MRDSYGNKSKCKIICLKGSAILNKHFFMMYFFGLSEEILLKIRNPIFRQTVLCTKKLIYLKEIYKFYLDFFSRGRVVFTLIVKQSIFPLKYTTYKIA